jgi:hypothetical protein
MPTVLETINTMSYKVYIGEDGMKKLGTWDKIKWQFF